MQTGVYLCCLYLWPDESSASRLIDIDLLDLLSGDVMCFEQLGSVLLVGDWNAHVGNRHDYVVCDSNLKDFHDCGYMLDNPLVRASQDSVCCL